MANHNLTPVYGNLLPPIIMRLQSTLISIIACFVLYTPYAKAQELDEHWEWDASKAIALALYDASEWEIALHYLDALGERTTDWYVQYVRSKTALHIGLVEHAHQIIQKALQYHESNPRILFLAADIAADKGNFEIALEYVQKGLVLRPEDVKANMNLGQILMAMQKYEKAAKHFETLHEKLPEDTEIPLKLAIAYENTGNLEKAEQYYVINSKIQTNQAVGMAPLYRFYLRHQKQEKAERLEKTFDKIQKAEDRRKLRPLMPSHR